MIQGNTFFFLFVIFLQKKERNKLMMGGFKRKVSKAPNSCPRNMLCMNGV